MCGLEDKHISFLSLKLCYHAAIIGFNKALLARGFKLSIKSPI
jgi:hypothetical protein